MRPTLFLMILTIIMALANSCITVKKASYEVLAHDETPPNGVRIGEFYCDKTEITNVNWLEYMFWTKKVYGSNSIEFLETQIDSLVWLDADSCKLNLVENYLRHPAYRDYPVVGITQEQAKKFTAWRSDRVFEYILIRDGIIEYNDSQNKYNVFTIANFFNGKIGRIDTITKVDYYPEFSLPTVIERKEILKYSDSIDLKYSSKYYSKHPKLKEISIIHGNVSPCSGNSEWINPTRSVMSYTAPKKIKNVFDLRGNVSEWAQEDNLTFGGNWGSEIAQILLFDEIKSSEASMFIGFRNICRYKKWIEN